jgi:hypothetical protein
MSLPRETMLELMAFADGELEGRARERAEKLVAENEEARRLVDAIRAPQLGEWIGEAVDARSAAADGIADAVMAKLASAPAHDPVAPVRDEGGVVRFAPPGRRRLSRPQVAAGAAVAALALAAGIAVIARVKGDEGGSPAPVASVAPTAELREPPAGSSAVAQQPALPRESVEVDEIDSPSRGVSVFEIPLGSAAAKAGPAGPSSVVIWIDDEPGAK